VPPRNAPYRPAAPIVPELAAGAVVLSESGERTLLLHQRDEDRWCFPKGHVDRGESLAKAAVREIREETGISRVRLGAELLEVTYRFYRPSAKVNVHKTVLYFLAHAPERSPDPEPLFDRFAWVGLDQARRLLKFDTDRRVIDAARALPPSKRRAGRT
jgi:8-oxo-(d)GTP phosphatase